MTRLPRRVLSVAAVPLAILIVTGCSSVEPPQSAAEGVSGPVPAATETAGPLGGDSTGEPSTSVSPSGSPSPRPSTPGATPTARRTTLKGPGDNGGRRPSATPSRTPRRSSPSPTPSAPRATPTKKTPPPASDASAYALRILTLVNAERAERGLGALRASSCAKGFAQRWAEHMRSTGKLEHQALRPVMTGCSARGAGENIAYGNVTPEQMMDMWMNSPGHKANILNAGFTHLGVGVARSSSGRWWGAQVFLTV